jgi:hypothetical protein
VSIAQRATDKIKFVCGDEEPVQAAGRHKVANFYRRLMLPNIVEGVGNPRRHGSEVARHQIDHLIADLDPTVRLCVANC